MCGLRVGAGEERTSGQHIIAPSTLSILCPRTKNTVRYSKA